MLKSPIKAFHPPLHSHPLVSLLRFLSVLSTFSSLRPPHSAAHRSLAFASPVFLNSLRSKLLSSSLFLDPMNTFLFSHFSARSILIDQRPWLWRYGLSWISPSLLLAASQTSWPAPLLLPPPQSPCASGFDAGPFSRYPPFPGSDGGFSDLRERSSFPCSVMCNSKVNIYVFK